MGNPKVYFDIAIDGTLAGRVVMEVSLTKRKRACAYLTAETGTVICLSQK